MGTDIRIALMLFTVFAPGGALAFLLMSIPIIVKGFNNTSSKHIARYLLVPISLCLIGLIASATHLGTPSNALYVLTGAGRSPLSNEVIAAVIFITLAWLYWLLAFVRLMPAALSRVWLVITDLSAIYLVYRISIVYSIPTIPTWNSSFTPMVLWCIALAVGPLVSLLTLAWAQYSSKEEDILVATGFYKVLIGIAMFGVLGGVIVMLLQNGELVTLSNAYATADQLFPYYIWCIGAFGVLGVISILLAATSIRRSDKPNRSKVTMAVLIIIFAAIVVRIPFYTMHMTVGF